jgi:lipopolysaccharide export system permease protein
MASDTEIIAILSSGISFRRMLVPYFLAAGILALMSFLLANFVIPYTNRSMLDFERKYVNDPKTNTDQNIHKQISPGTFIYIENYSKNNKTGWRFSLEQFRNREMVFKLMADRIEWDSIHSRWKLEKYYARTIDGPIESLRQGKNLDTVLALQPKDFIEDIEEVKVMNFFSLREQKFITLTSSMSSIKSLG